MVVVSEAPWQEHLQPSSLGCCGWWLLSREQSCRCLAAMVAHLPQRDIACRPRPSNVWHSLLDLPGCNPLCICFSSLNSGTHRRKLHQKSTFWQQLLQHIVFSLIICLLFPISVQLQGVKAGQSCGCCYQHHVPVCRVTPPSSLCWWVDEEHRKRPAHCWMLSSVVANRKRGQILSLTVTCHTPTNHHSLPVKQG